MLKHIEFLSAADCTRAAAQVHALRAHWETRHPQAPFFTLGAASYLDAVDPATRAVAYYQKAARHNPLLLAEFSWLYDKLLAGLQTELGAPCAFERRSARPGFHIFLAHELFRQPLASIHVDLQYQLIDWSEHADPDFEHPLSFTAGIALPRAGAGLHTWDIHYDCVRNKPMSEITQIVHTTPPLYHRYRLGALALHSGHTVHQIAPMPEIEPGNAQDARITLQGHAVKSAGTWWVYW